MITPDELWTEAVEQAQRATSEVAQRQAIAALYYALYHTVGERIGIDTSQGDGNHARVARAVKEIHGRAAARYDNVRALRVRAQYFLHSNVGSTDLRLARDGAAAVRQILQIPPRSLPT